mmetsp:Transcript_58139/g.118199  ORF Transcript_58139/g.118199 Transcript_58139/m.118199 type:complete len:219 (-) Transcript_58139:726-1382(-)
MHHEVRKAIEIEGICWSCCAMILHRPLGHHDVVPAGAESSDPFEVGGVSSTSCTLTPKVMHDIEMGGKEDAPVVLVGERLPRIPQVEELRPLHDDQGLGLWEVLPRRRDGAKIELLQEAPRNTTAWLVEELDAIAGVPVGFASPGHGLHGTDRQVPVESCVEELVSEAHVATRESIACLTSRRSMEVQKHCQTSGVGILKDPVDPLTVFLRAHHFLQP